MNAPTWLVARRLRDDEDHLGPAGSWKLAPDLLDEYDAHNRARYFEEALGCRVLAVDLDSLEAHLSRGAL